METEVDLWGRPLSCTVNSVLIFLAAETESTLADIAKRMEKSSQLSPSELVPKINKGTL